MSHLIFAAIILLVTLVSIISVVRQLKFKNLLALGFSAVSALVFGFFSIATIISVIQDTM